MNKKYLIFFLASFISFGLARDLIVLKPDDPFVFLGECLTFYCSLTSTRNGNSSTLYVAFKKEVFPEQRYEIVDEKTMKFNVCITHMEEAGSYICKQNVSKVESQLKDPFAGQVVYTEKALVPIPKDSIKCLLLDWKVMNCSWSLGEMYWDPTQIQVNLTYKITKVSKCPKQLQTSCQWTRRQSDLSVQYLMNLTVFHNRRPKKKLVTAFIVPRLKTVKPSEVYLGRNSLSTNSSCFKIKWNHSSFYKVTYKVTISSKDQEIPTVLTRSRYAEICELLPQEKYNVSISAFPKSGPGNWSNPHFLAVITNGTYPSRPPLIYNSSFEWKSDHSKVVLYWQNLNRQQSGSKNIWYWVSVENYTTQAYSAITVANLTLHKTSEKCWLIHVWAENQFGRSKSTSSVRICNDISVPATVENVELLTLNDTHVKVMWSKPSLEKAPVSYFKVLVCKNCSVDLQWFDVDANKTSVILPVDYSGASTFGVTAENENGSSGLTIAHCLYHRSKPKKPVDGFSVQPFNGKLQLYWRSYNCLEEKAFIVEYQIKYCVALNKSQCKEKEKVKTVARKQENFETPELSPNNYLVWIEPITYAGFGPPTIKKMVKISSSFSTGIILIIIIGTACALILTILVLIFIYKKCASQIDKCNPKMNFPTIEQTETSKTGIFTNNSSIPSDNDSSPTFSTDTKDTHLSAISLCNGTFQDYYPSNPEYVQIGMDSSDSKGSMEKTQLPPNSLLSVTQQQNANNNAVPSAEIYQEQPDATSTSRCSQDKIFDNDRINLISDNFSLSNFDNHLGELVECLRREIDPTADKLGQVKNTTKETKNGMKIDLEPFDRSFPITKKQLTEIVPTPAGTYEVKLKMPTLDNDFQSVPNSNMPNGERTTETSAKSDYVQLTLDSSSSNESMENSDQPQKPLLQFAEKQRNAVTQAEDVYVSPSAFTKSSAENSVNSFERDDNFNAKMSNNETSDVDEKNAKNLKPSEIPSKNKDCFTSEETGVHKDRMPVETLVKDFSKTIIKNGFRNDLEEKFGNDFATNKLDNNIDIYVDSTDAVKLNGQHVTNAQVKEIDNRDRWRETRL